MQDKVKEVPMGKVDAVELVSVDGVMEAPEEWAFLLDELMLMVHPIVLGSGSASSGTGATIGPWSSWTQRRSARASSTSPTGPPGE
jgi:hypothetical protein